MSSRNKSYRFCKSEAFIGATKQALVTIIIIFFLANLRILFMKVTVYVATV